MYRCIEYWAKFSFFVLMVFCLIVGITMCMIFYRNKKERKYLADNYNIVTVIKGNDIMTMEEFENKFGSFKNYDIIIDQNTNSVFVY